MVLRNCLLVSLVLLIPLCAADAQDALSEELSLSFFQADFAQATLGEEASLHAHDFDGDGRTEIVAAGREVIARRLENKRLVDAGFAFPRLPTRARRALAWDADHDERLDLLLIAEDWLHLWLQREPGVFAAAPDSDFPASLPGIAGGHPFDCDWDGDLDLLLWRRNPAVGESAVVLLRNNGDLRFADITESAGLRLLRALVVDADSADLNGDGRLDLALLDQRHGLRLMLAGEPGSFQPSALHTKASGRHGGLALEIADLDADGDFDLVATSFLPGRSLIFMMNDGRGSFRERRPPDDLFPPAISTLRAVDYDLDGRLDLVVTTLSKHSGTQLGLYRGLGGAEFVSRSNVPLAVPEARGLSLADFDGNGTPDFAVRQVGGVLPILNLGAHLNGWLKCRPRSGAHSGGCVPPFGAGGRLRVKTGERVQTWPLEAPELLLGLAGAATAEWVEVLWPDGSSMRVSDASKVITLPWTADRAAMFPQLLLFDGEDFAPYSSLMAGEPEWRVLRLRKANAEEKKLRLRVANGTSRAYRCDALWLYSVEHPSDAEPAWVSGEAGPASVQVADASRWLLPGAAWDGEGNTVLEALLAVDGHTAPDTLPAYYHGQTQPWAIVLDFGIVAASSHPVLFLQGDETPIPESVLRAVAQDGSRSLALPSVSTGDGRGGWQTPLQSGGPLMRAMGRTGIELGKALLPHDARVRISGNTALHLDRAALVLDGFLPAEEVRQLESLSAECVTGALRAEDLAGEDGVAAILRRGEHWTVEFSLAGLPPPREGWQRSYLLYSVGGPVQAGAQTQ